LNALISVPACATEAGAVMLRAATVGTGFKPVPTALAVVSVDAVRGDIVSARFRIALTKTIGYTNILTIMKAILTEGRKKYLAKIAEISFQIMFAAAFLTEFFTKLSGGVKILIAFCIVGCVVIGFVVSPEKDGE